MVQYKEIRKMSMGELRSLCIRRGWYTKGTEEEYSKLLYMTKAEEITTNTLAEMANDILMHSQTNCELKTIMFELSLICYSVFDEVTED